MRASGPGRQPPATVQQREGPDSAGQRPNGRDEPRTALAGIVELLSRGFVTVAAVTFFVTGVVLLAILVLT